MRWDDFAAAPELAKLGEERLRSRELCMVGTLRRNGWPRISPVEPEFVDGELMRGPARAVRFRSSTTCAAPHRRAIKADRLGAAGAAPRPRGRYRVGGLG